MIHTGADADVVLIPGTQEKYLFTFPAILLNFQFLSFGFSFSFSFKDAVQCTGTYHTHAPEPTHFFPGKPWKYCVSSALSFRLALAKFEPALHSLHHFCVSPLEFHRRF